MYELQDQEVRLLRHAECAPLRRLTVRQWAMAESLMLRGLLALNEGWWSLTAEGRRLLGRHLH